jgi:hypothetical protein
LQQPAEPVTPSAPVAIQFNGHAYQVFLEPATQSEAAARCRKQGGYLAQIETAAENAAVLAAALKSETGPAYLWIAGYRPDGSSDWLFETKKEPMTFFCRGIDSLNASDAGPCALAMAVDNPVVYWQSLNPEARTSGFVCEWNDSVIPQGRAEE